MTFSLRDVAELEKLDTDGVEILRYHPNGKQMLLQDSHALTIRDSIHGHILHTLAKREDRCFDALYSPSGKEIAVCLGNVVKFWNVSSSKFTDIVIPCRCLDIKYITEDKLAYTDEYGSIHVVYTDTGILIMKKTAKKMIGALGILNKHVLMYTQDQEVYTIELPHYNYSKLTKRRLETGIVEDLVAANAHPLMLTRERENSPVQDKKHFQTLFTGIKSINSRHKFVERVTKLLDEIKSHHSKKKLEKLKKSTTTQKTMKKR
jgi:hypothetical protein